MVTWGWHATFLALAIPALLMLIVALPYWHETQWADNSPRQAGFKQVLQCSAFWTYTLAFGSAMGSFFVFFSTAPRVLIEGAGLSELNFSLAFATVALVMIITARFAKHFVERWGIQGSVARGMAALILGACAFAMGESASTPSFWSFILPMWLVAIGIVFTTSVTANGALEKFGEIAGAAVALHFCIQSLIVGVIGTAYVIALDGNTAWPLIAYALTMASITLLALIRLNRNNPRPTTI